MSIGVILRLDAFMLPMSFHSEYPGGHFFIRSEALEQFLQDLSRLLGAAS
jgi:hypothetical protein